ncbi:MAG TPA: hypothetical protein VHG28_23320 [Longimicrobiaceae bacterium]|nr:hypothetical protein [Longimicrobiaceae bacterium]
MKRFLTLFLLAGLAACDLFTGSDGDDEQRVPRVGDRLQLNVQFRENCTNPILRGGRVVAVSQRLIVVADTSNPAPGFSDADYQEFASTFDNLVWPVDTRTFGEPTDIDKNDRIIAFFTRAINELTAPTSNSFVSGLVYSRDLFPKKETGNFAACQSSNEAELMYLMVPDPSRGGAFTHENVKRSTVGVLAHEFQHVLNAGRRLYVQRAPQNVWNEEVWLNEGLSHIAEELVFYEASALSSRRNIDLNLLRSTPTILNAVNAYQVQNLSRLINYYGNPEQNSPYDTDDDLAARGAAWAFLRYAADRRDGDDRAFFNALVNSNVIGLANLRAALGGSTDPIPWVRDWNVSVYTDDAVSGVDARFTQPSWNFRSVLPALRSNQFPLRVRPLTNGVSTGPITLNAGGAAYLRFAVAPGGRAEVRAGVGGAPATGSCPGGTQVSGLQVGQVFHSPAGAPQLLCVDGGASGGEFTLIPFYGSEASSANIVVDFTATGIQTVTGPPNPSLSPFDAPLVSFQGAPVYQEDLRIERAVRERERELGRLIRGGGATRSVSAPAAQDPTRLSFSVVRTR